MEKTSLFIKIDEFIFQKLDLLKNEGVFQKFNDVTAAFDENQQKIIAQIITFFFLLAPFVFVIVLWWGNSQTRKDIDIKKQIIDQIALLDGNKTALGNISSNYLAPTPINGQQELDNKIRNLLSAQTIDQAKVTISGFNQLSSSSSLSKIEADITFRGFGTTDFSNFMRGMIEQERFKILKVDLTKDRENNLLQGSISLMHMGQNPISTEP